MRPNPSQRTRRLRSQEQTDTSRSKSTRQETGSPHTQTCSPFRPQVAEQAKEQQLQPSSRRSTTEAIHTLTPPTTDTENSDPISSAADPQEDSWESEGATSPALSTVAQSRALAAGRQRQQRLDAMEQTEGDDALLIHLDREEECEILGIETHTTTSPPRDSTGESSPMETDATTPDTPMETDVSTSDTNTISSFQPRTKDEWLAEWRQETNRRDSAVQDKLPASRTRTDQTAGEIEGTCRHCRVAGFWFWTRHSEEECRKGGKHRRSPMPDHARKNRADELANSIINLANMTSRGSVSGKNDRHAGTADNTKRTKTVVRMTKADEGSNDEGIPYDLLREVEALPPAPRVTLSTSQKLKRRMERIKSQEASGARMPRVEGSRWTARCKFCWQNDHNQHTCHNKRETEERSVESTTDYQYRFHLERQNGVLPYPFQRQEGKLSVAKLLENRGIGAFSRMITPTLGPYGIDLLMDSGLRFCSMRLGTLTRLILSTTSGTLAAKTIRSYEPGQLAPTGPLSLEASRNLHTAYVVLRFGDIGWSSVPFIIDDRDSGIDGLNDAFFRNWQVVTEACSVEDGNPCVCGSKTPQGGRHLHKMEWSADPGRWENSYMATRSECDETQTTAASTTEAAPLFRTGALHLA